VTASATSVEARLATAFAIRSCLPCNQITDERSPTVPAISIEPVNSGRAGSIARRAAYPVCTKLRGSRRSATRAAARMRAS
jgi:hypothetical protein